MAVSYAAVGYQLSAVGYQLSAVSFGLRIEPAG
jgi:hypothetical protein